MSAVANRLPDRRAEVVRWVICFVVVVAVHGIGAMALMDSSTETSDFGVDTPVVMVVDLPESLVPLMAPPLDKPVGPIEEEETDPTPPPKEETKPPEPEAEVAIPIPEPPKPEPPREEKHESAPPQANAPRVVVNRWQNRLMAHIERFKRYPNKAHGSVGSTKVSFTIDHEGHLLSSHIVQSSGSATLDDEALNMLARAKPFPRPPDQTPDAELTIVFQMNFEPPR